MLALNSAGSEQKPQRMISRRFYFKLTKQQSGVWLLLGALLLANTLPCKAATLFAGITALEASPVIEGRIQPLKFESDIPFQYQMQILDHNRILLRLYNARLAGNLLMPEGSLNFLAQGAVEAGQKVSPKNRQAALASNESYEEIILKGPGLGDKKLVITGATEYPIAFSMKESSEEITPVVPEPYTTAKRIEPQDQEATSFLSLGTPETKSKPTKAEKPGIQIASISTASQTGSISLTRSNIKPSQAEETPSLEDTSSTYRGIEAITLDSSGKPIRLVPKNQPLSFYDISPQATRAASASSNEPKRQFHLAQALILCKEKNYASALTHLAAAQAVAPNDPVIFEAQGEAYVQLKQWDKARAACQKAYSLDPERYGKKYAEVLILSGAQRQALPLLESLVEHQPNNSELAYMLGTLYENLGQTDKALDMLKRAESLHPASSDIQYNLGLAYELSGDKLLAEKHYRQALSLDSQATEIQKALQRVQVQ